MGIWTACVGSIQVCTWTALPPGKIFLPSATKLRRLCCFYTCLSFCSRGGGGLPQYMLGYHPQTHSPPRTKHPPPIRPPGADPPGTRHPPPREQTPHRPWDQAPSLGTRHTPPDQAPPPKRRLLLWAVRILLECILV